MSIQALYTAASGMNSMQTKLDVIANDLLIHGLQWTGTLAGMASEEMEHPLPIPPEFRPWTSPDTAQFRKHARLQS